MSDQEDVHIEQRDATRGVRLSVVDLFTVGIGPSSSHTIGPMRAAHRFVEDLRRENVLSKTHAVVTKLFGSLALTGKGHGTDRAILIGLSGELPDSVDPDRCSQIVEQVRSSETLTLGATREVRFTESEHLQFCYEEILPQHPNGMRFEAVAEDGRSLSTREYFSVGGGFVVCEDEIGGVPVHGDNVVLKHAFSSADELLERGQETGLTISEMVAENELAWRSAEETRDYLLKVRDVMRDCIARGCRQKGHLPGPLNVKRRAPSIHVKLSSTPEQGLKDPLTVLDWINLYALAVSEENASGGRVVTAPTNGAAGVVPAVLTYYERFCPASDDEGVLRFLLTAGAIGALYKHKASISGAEVGCQGEVGVACSMAAGGLTAALGGTNAQIENAAEIGMEHNLGLTCDPIAGLVQVPCIERNTMGAAKAVNASRLALNGDGSHAVSLDKVIETMRQTGLDMQTKYKETSQGGLAVNLVEC